jgi:hypothetical protein
MIEAAYAPSLWPDTKRLRRPRCGPVASTTRGTPPVMTMPALQNCRILRIGCVTGADLTGRRSYLAPRRYPAFRTWLHSRRRFTSPPATSGQSDGLARNNANAASTRRQEPTLVTARTLAIYNVYNGGCRRQRSQRPHRTSNPSPGRPSAWPLPGRLSRSLGLEPTTGLGALRWCKYPAGSDRGPRGPGPGAGGRKAPLMVVAYDRIATAGRLWTRDSTCEAQHAPPSRPSSSVPHALPADLSVRMRIRIVEAESARARVLPPAPRAGRCKASLAARLAPPFVLRTLAPHAGSGSDSRRDRGHDPSTGRRGLTPDHLGWGRDTGAAVV